MAENDPVQFTRNSAGRIGDSVRYTEQIRRGEAPGYRRRPVGGSGYPGFYANITASAADGTNRWKYDFVQVEKTVAGYDGWTTKTDGITGDDAGGDPARNTVEDMNDAAGVQGNGVDLANLDTADYTFTIQAAPAGVIIWMRAVTFTDAAGDKITEYWFSYENGVDGECD